MKISQLLILRKNSKFFAKFLIGWLKNTRDFNNVELLILANDEDTWNRDYFEYYKDKFKVFYEHTGWGKEGRAKFYDILAKEATGDFLWHMCDDHYLIRYGYDDLIINYIKENQIPSDKPSVIIPQVSNSGSISHILSRGYFEATGSMGRHGNIDSYINSTLTMCSTASFIHHMSEDILLDFTVDQTIMTPEHSKIELDQSITWNSFDSQDIFQLMLEDSKRIVRAL